MCPASKPNDQVELPRDDGENDGPSLIVNKVKLVAVVLDCFWF